MERWAAVPDYPAYEVSDYGRVRRAFCHCGARLAEPRYLRGRADKDGYPRIALRDRGRHRDIRLPRLVLLAFVGDPPTARHEAAHGDGNRTNNQLSNLRWATPSENASDKIRHGTHRRGNLINFTKLTENQVRQIRRMRDEGASVTNIAASMKASPGNVRHILRGDSWRHVA